MLFENLLLFFQLIALFQKETLAKQNANLDLNDEKDDGTTLVLGDSEIVIVPPEVDEDQTDDQATDSDKPEDLEDLKHLETIYVHRNASDYYHPEEPSSISFSGDTNLFIGKDGNYEKLNGAKEIRDANSSDDALKTSTHKNRHPKSKSGKPGRVSGHKEDYRDYYDQESRLTELSDNREANFIEDIESNDKESLKDWKHYYTKDIPENSAGKKNQFFLVLIVFFSALIVLTASVTIVLFAKLKLNHRRQNRRRTNDKLLDDYEDSVN